MNWTVCAISMWPRELMSMTHAPTTLFDAVDAAQQACAKIFSSVSKDLTVERNEKSM
jgi:hypothetical protein